MKDRPSKLSNLLKHTHGMRVLPIIDSALSEVDPFRAVSRAIRMQDEVLIIAGRRFDFRMLEKIFLVSVGKAACPMALAVETVLGEKLTAGIVVTKSGFKMGRDPMARGTNVIRILEAGHPIPDENGVAAAHAIENLLASTGSKDLVICLISGGGSALLTLPAEGIQLGDLQILTGLLLRSGATIQELNTLRKHLEQLKGGGLAKLISPAAGTALVLSDVIGDPLDVIASGPTVPDSTTFEDCLKIISHYELTDQIPAAILKHLERGLAGKIEETPKPGDPIFNGISAQVIANNYSAAQAALERAEMQGFNTLLLTSCIDGEARYVGRLAAAVAAQIQQSGQPVSRPACILMGGETTVHVRGSGKGGRNLELALGAVEKMAGLPDAMLITLATDGDDGSTQAAGAIVTGSTFEDGLQLGMHADDYLDRNDAYTYFQRLNSLIVTGPTLTNVNDLVLLFCF